MSVKDSRCTRKKSCRRVNAARERVSGRRTDVLPAILFGGVAREIRVYTVSLASRSTYAFVRSISYYELENARWVANNATTIIILQLVVDKFFRPAAFLALMESYLKLCTLHRHIQHSLRSGKYPRGLRNTAYCTITVGKVLYDGAQWRAQRCKKKRVKIIILNLDSNSRYFTRSFRLVLVREYTNTRETSKLRQPI